MEEEEELGGERLEGGEAELRPAHMGEMQGLRICRRGQAVRPSGAGQCVKAASY